LIKVFIVGSYPDLAKKMKIEEQKKKDATLVKVALRMSQFDKKLYQFFLSAGEIHELVTSGNMDIDRWNPQNEEGYQRIPTESRYKKYGRYVVQKKGMTPVSLTLSLRDKGALRVEELGNDVVKLRIDLGRAMLYIPDGQHRAYGLRWAVDQYLDEVKEYQIPVVMFLADGDDPRYEEATQFYTINNNAKRVKTDLYQRYLLKTREKELDKITDRTPIPSGVRLKDLEPYAVKIVDMLNSNGPFSKRISLPNVSSETASISQNSFVDSIKPLLTFASEAGWDTGKVVEAINAYWVAIKAKCPESFNHWSGDSCNENSEDHFNAVLVTTTGVNSLNDVLKRMMTLPEVLDKPTSPEVYKRILDKPSLDDYFSDGKNGFWGSESEIDESASRRGTSKKSFKELADDIWEAVKET
jgi:DGQHR domain-containing protein